MARTVLRGPRCSNAPGLPGEFRVHALDHGRRPTTLAGCVFASEGLAAETRDYWHTSEEN
ncbi:hypothetical protein [Nonomuraea sp. NPDC046570]|uniref:hypothetical protein n=1 Tax=Nonomuraea sp. NPDC046570 TaxID=3155255 RepID=UPI003408FA39